MNTLEEFTQKVQSNEQQFYLKPDTISHILFTQIPIGNAKCVYGGRGYRNENFVAELDTKLEPYAIVSNDAIFLVRTYGLTESFSENDYPDSTYTLSSKTEELNRKVKEELFPAFYESLPISELTEEQLQRADKSVRETILEDGGKIKGPSIGDLIDKQMTVNILCGLIDFDEFISSKFEKEKDYYIGLKSYNNMLNKFAQELKNVENWEVEMNNSLRELDAKTVTVVFEYEGKTATDKIEKNTLLRKLVDDDYFSDYYFSTSVKGKQIIKDLGAATWRGDSKEPLLCKHIIKITYGKNVIYSK